jgi:hypothetical protein
MTSGSSGFEHERRPREGTASATVWRPIRGDGKYVAVGEAHRGRLLRGDLPGVGFLMRSVQGVVAAESGGDAAGVGMGEQVAVLIVAVGIQAAVGSDRAGAGHAGRFGVASGEQPAQRVVEAPLQTAHVDAHQVVEHVIGVAGGVGDYAAAGIEYRRLDHCRYPA